MTWELFADRACSLKSAPLEDITELMYEFCDDPETSIEDCERMLAALTIVNKRFSAFNHRKQRQRKS